MLDPEAGPSAGGEGVQEDDAVVQETANGVSDSALQVGGANDPKEGKYLTESAERCLEELRDIDPQFELSGQQASVP
jgi:hypothetical protein